MTHLTNLANSARDDRSMEVFLHAVIEFAKSEAIRQRVPASYVDDIAVCVAREMYEFIRICSGTETFEGIDNMITVCVYSRWLSIHTKEEIERQHLEKIKDILVATEPRSDYLTEAEHAVAIEGLRANVMKLRDKRRILIDTQYYGPKVLDTGELWEAMKHLFKTFDRMLVRRQKAYDELKEKTLKLIEEMYEEREAI